jgi:magnesium transporter
MKIKANMVRPMRRSRKAGLPPGTLVHVGEKKVEAVRLTYIDYDEHTVQEKVVSNVMAAGILIYFKKKNWL